MLGIHGMLLISLRVALRRVAGLVMVAVVGRQGLMGVLCLHRRKRHIPCRCVFRPTRPWLLRRLLHGFPVIVKRDLIRNHPSLKI